MCFVPKKALSFHHSFSDMPCNCRMSEVGGREKVISGGCLEKTPEEPSFSNLAGHVVRDEVYINKMKAKTKVNSSNVVSLPQM